MCVVLLRRRVSLLPRVRGRILLRLVVLMLTLRLAVVLLTIVVLPIRSLLVVGVAWRVWTEVALRRRGLIASAHLCVGYRCSDTDVLIPDVVRHVDLDVRKIALNLLLDHGLYEYPTLPLKFAMAAVNDTENTLTECLLYFLY